MYIVIRNPWLDFYFVQKTLDNLDLWFIKI